MKNPGAPSLQDASGTTGSMLALQAIFDNAAVGIVLTRNRVVEHCNRRMAEIMGMTVEELVGAPGSIFYPSPESYREIGQQAGPELAAGRPFQADWQLRRKDGRPIWVHIYARAVDSEHTDQGTVWIVDDVTERHQTRLALTQALQRMEALMANAPVGILITQNRRMTHFNERFIQMFGFQADEALYQPARMLYRSDEEYAQVGRLAGPLLSQGKPFQQEIYMRRQDGQNIWVNLIGYVESHEDTPLGTFWILEDRTAFKAAEENLQRLSAEQQLILDNSMAGICFIRDGVILRCNRRTEEIYDYGPGKMAGQPTRILYFSDESHARVEAIAAEALARRETFAVEVVHRRRDQQPLWVRITGKAIDPANPHGGSIWNFEDISARKLAEESARQTEVLQRAILESASLAIISTNVNGYVISANPAAEAMLGFSASELVGRQPVASFVVPESLPSFDLEVLDFGHDPLLGHARLGELEEIECSFRRKDGSMLPVHLSISALHHHGDEQVRGFLLLATDISERKQAVEALRKSRDVLEERVRERTASLEVEIAERRNAERLLRHIAHHDPLTDLPNRALLRQRVDEACRRARQNGQHVGVFFIDLDRFKTINDSLGHHVGDSLLKEVARRLSTALRAGDTVARLGGDEFVVVIPNLEAPAMAEQVARKLLAALTPACHIEGHEIFVTPSIGICTYPNDGPDTDTLLRNADTAMYRAKGAGRNTWCLFDRTMTAATEQYFQIETSLRHAIERREFEVFYQPIVSLADGRPAAFEALIRWRHPQLGLLTPDRFIPVAEDTGLIVPIGEQVLASVCSLWRSWQSVVAEPPPVCVNVSAIQFRAADIAESLSSIVRDAGVPAGAIELEITESALMEDCEKTLATLEKLSDRGFRLSIDDFGTGYSSLAYLKRFPVDKLKVDRSFIKDMTEDENDEAIVATVLALSRTLKLGVVAEGAETAAQVERLRDMGCDCVQGYYFARPLPADEIAARYLKA